MLYKYPTYLQFDSFSATSYNNLTSQQKIIVDDVQSVIPVEIYKRNNNLDLDSRAWTITGNRYCGVYIRNNHPVYVYVSKKGESFTGQTLFRAEPNSTVNMYAPTSGPSSSYTSRNGYVYGIWEDSASTFVSAGIIPIYNTLEDLLLDADSMFPGAYPITYRDINCTSNGPVNSASGETVTVNYTFPDGYGIVNSSTDIYVTNNGVLVPSNYSNGTLTFTMPDPT